MLIYRIERLLPMMGLMMHLLHSESRNLWDTDVLLPCLEEPELVIGGFLCFPLPDVEELTLEPVDKGAPFSP